MTDESFTAACDGTRQRYVCIRPDSPGEGEGEAVDVLIALHGHGADRWQFATDPRDECRAARDVAAERRMILVSPDYRAPSSWMGPAAESDVLDLITRLKRLWRVSRVFLCGGSMGGASALTFAVQQPAQLAGVVAMNGIADHLEFTGFQDAIRASFGGRKDAIPEEYRRRSAVFRPERLRMPVGLTSGGRDTVTPPASLRRLVNALTANNPSVLHIHREDEVHRTSREDARRVLEFVLDAAPCMCPG